MLGINITPVNPPAAAALAPVSSVSRNSSPWITKISEAIYPANGNTKIFISMMFSAGVFRSLPIFEIMPFWIKYPGFFHEKERQESISSRFLLNLPSGLDGKFSCAKVGVKFLNLFNRKMNSFLESENVDFRIVVISENPCPFSAHQKNRSDA